MTQPRGPVREFGQPAALGGPIVRI
jgi:hypothetical protein